MADVFLSYRRSDTPHLSARIYELFERHFGEGGVFFDVDTLPRYAGWAFADVIRETVPQCKVFLAIIGPNWARLIAGRFEDRSDFVQIEIGIALNTPGVRVVPVLVDGATMPQPHEMPPALQGLLSRQCVTLPQDPHFRRSVNDLAASLLGGSRPASVASLAVSEEQRRSTTPGAEFRDGEGFPLMVTIPPGVLLRGSPSTERDRRDNEGPQREVRIGYPLAVGKYPVTVGNWKAFVAATGGDRDSSWAHPSFAQDDSHPVVRVSWEDAQSYLTWIASVTGQPYRLLSEAEWEYACRAGSRSRYAFGDEISTVQANFGRNVEGTTPSDTYSANAFGLRDMHGNVWEWVADRYAPYARMATDGRAVVTDSCPYHVVRGGSWSNEPQLLRSANRLWSDPTGRYYSIGFRVARNAGPLAT